MPKKLIDGLRRFRSEYFPQYREHYAKLVAEGQKPTTLFVGCSDSRIDPSLVFDAMPGDLFVVRNVGNFIPPFEADDGFHGTSAALEFGTVVLGVTDIVVCGHSHCGAVRALYALPDANTPHLNRWLELGREAMVAEPPDESVLRRTEQRSVALQVQRLLSFPMIRERVEAGTLSLHGWHYVIEEGAVYFLDVGSGTFKPLTSD